jgi:alpha-1,2-mannosyltransferase
LAVANLAVMAWFLLSFRRGLSADVYRVDLDVYRLGATVWRHGGKLYGQLPALRFGRHHLPFTYPPIAAIVLTPFALMPFGLASAAMTMAMIAALALVLVVTLRSLDVQPHKYLVCALLPAALVLEPVRSTLNYGQIDVLLMALVVPDCLVHTPRWPRGMLVGLAAAIKLTPAAFVLFFLLRGDRRAALTAAVSFLGTTGVGFLLAWRDSVRFWTATVVDTGRIGGIMFAANQSIKALLARLSIQPGALWLPLAVTLLAMTAIAVHRAFAAGRPTWALGLNAFGALPASPISWSHHWVWAAPFLVTAGVDAWRTRTRCAIALTTGGTLVFILPLHWWWRGTDPWTAWRLLTGNTYLFTAVAVVTHAAFSHAGQAPPPQKSLTNAQTAGGRLAGGLSPPRHHGRAEGADDDGETGNQQ